VAFQPNADGWESEGPFEIAFAPPMFPPGLNNGIFVGFFGHSRRRRRTRRTRSSSTPGTGEYFHFIEAFQLGHPDAFTTSDDSLFVADMSSREISSPAGTGVIYQIKRDTTPPTAHRLVHAPRGQLAGERHGFLSACRPAAPAPRRSRSR